MPSCKYFYRNVLLKIPNMFEKIFLIVQECAGPSVVDKFIIPEKHKESIIIEASSSIIEVLKVKAETGKLSELIHYFHLKHHKRSPITFSIEKRFTERLKQYYGLSNDESRTISEALIPVIMDELVKKVSDDKEKEITLIDLLCKLTGNRAGIRKLINDMIEKTI